MSVKQFSLVSVTVKLHPEHFPVGLFFDQVVPKGAEVCDVCNGEGCDWCDYQGYMFIEALD